MIQNRKDLAIYMEADRRNLGFIKKKPSFFGNDVWKFEILLRKYEYSLNTKKVSRFFYKFLFKRKSLKLGFDIPPNVFGKGLAIHHYGCITVNPNAKVGENCILQQGVNIGQNYSSENVPTIGDNVYIGPGAKIFGKIIIANGVAIGAGSVVNKSFLEENVAIAGNPAKVIGKRKAGLV